MCADAVARGETDCALLMAFSLSDIPAEALLPDLLQSIGMLDLPLAGFSAFAALGEPLVSCYLERVPPAQELEKLASAIIDSALLPAPLADIELCRLENVASHRGASFGEPAAFHYVVRTDVEPGGEAELQAWYDEEHMPMLAAVPGTIRARRLRSLDAKPQFYACYDLTAPGVIESAAWLQVRATPWSERVRPTFRNTRRTMYRRLPLPEGGLV